MTDNIVDLAPKPDAETMRTQLYALFRHAMQGMVEVGYTDKNGALNRAKQFDVGDLDDLVSFAARINAESGRNVYFSAGLRRINIERDSRASDGDVIAAAALKIDCDTPGCFQEALKDADKLGLRPNLAHFTGKSPHTRGALWWVLEEPDPDLERVRRIEAALARVFAADPKVVNPSRVMRLPGSVAWPYKQGRVTEMTGAYTEAPLRPAVYSLDEIESALRRHGHNPSDTRAGAQIIDFSAAAHSLELESLIEQAAQPNEWHQNALLAVAHLIGRNCPPDVAVDVLAARLTQPGYSVDQTRIELGVMAAGAAAKWGAAQASPYAQPATGRDPFPLIAYPDIGLQGPPEWRIEGLLPKQGFGVLYGPSGAYKSFIALDLALTIAHGMSWRGQKVEPCAVAYLAGEGSYGIQNRIAVWRDHRGKGQMQAPFWLAPTSSNFLDPDTVKLIAERLKLLNTNFIVVDTVARAFGAGDENKTQDMNRFVAACDYLKDACGALVLGVHHTGKEEDRGERGSSALRAAVDVRLSVSRGTNESAAVIHVAKQKDGEDGQRYRVRLVKVESHHPTTGEVISSLVPVTEDEPVKPPVTELTKLGKNDRRVLDLLNEAPMRFGQIKARLDIDSGTIGRSLRRLFSAGMVTQEEDVWAIASGITELLIETED